MGLKDMLRASDYKETAEMLQTEVDRLRSMLSPAQIEADEVKQRLAGLNRAKAAASEEIKSLNAEIARLSAEAAQKRSQMVTFDDVLLVQQFGLYEPRFSFADSTAYKDRLKSCRDRQKEEIKSFSASLSNSTWQVNGSAAQGNKMVKQLGKLLMRSYNVECDEIVRKVKATNVAKSIEQVYKSAASINNLCTVIGIGIPESFQRLKEDEVRLAYEYQVQKEKEKEEIREAREREREARKLEKEIAEARKKLEKEKKQYENAFNDLAKKIESASDADRRDLQEKIDELKRKMDEVDAAVKDVDYREANERAGFVYVISNIGSFGEGVYKIGMTRRLDPMERVKELGDASVPFGFDVHALIFCDDAPKLEAALHREFEDRKVNLVNQRREFFRVSIEEIEEVVKKNYDKTVDFVATPDAEQYRESEAMRLSMN